MNFQIILIWQCFAQTSQRRDKLLPRQSINFQMILIWQCFAQTSQRRDKLSMKAQRVEHLHFMIVVSIKIVAQMLNPYKFVFIGL